VDHKYEIPRGGPHMWSHTWGTTLWDPTLRPLCGNRLGQPEGPHVCPTMGTPGGPLLGNPHFIHHSFAGTSSGDHSRGNSLRGPALGDLLVVPDLGAPIEGSTVSTHLGTPLLGPPVGDHTWGKTLEVPGLWDPAWRTPLLERTWGSPMLNTPYGNPLW
jgi:hypothetical protein